MKHKVLTGSSVTLIALMVIGQVAGAQVNSSLSQTITGGTISTSIKTAGGVDVVSPSFAMSAATVSNAPQTVTGTFGSDSQRITVSDQRGTGNGWTLALAGADGDSTVWTTGGATPETYPFNGTASTGQLTVNPTAATITPTAPNTTTGVSKGSQAAFSGATPVTLMQAGGSAEKVWNGYMTGVGLSQVIPAYTSPGNYTIELVQTVTGS